jgi:hypothetical protein
MEPVKPDLQNERLKKLPFTVPEGYFESFHERLKDRISRMEPDQVTGKLRLRTLRLRIMAAAALFILALATYPLIRLVTQQEDEPALYPEIALLEGAGVLDNEYELALYLDEEETEMDAEEAYLNQAMDFLATGDVELDLIFE